MSNFIQIKINQASDIVGPCVYIEDKHVLYDGTCSGFFFEALCACCIQQITKYDGTCSGCFFEALCACCIQQITKYDGTCSGHFFEALCACCIQQITKSLLKGLLAQCHCCFSVGLQIVGHLFTSLLTRKLSCGSYSCTPCYRILSSPFFPFFFKRFKPTTRSHMFW